MSFLPNVFVIGSQVLLQIVLAEISGTYITFYIILYLPDLIDSTIEAIYTFDGIVNKNTRFSSMSLICPTYYRTQIFIWLTSLE